MLGDWPCAHNKIRAVETALIRLRIGHVSLKEHFFRFNVVSDPFCECGEVESIPHYLLFCPLFEDNRNELRNDIYLINQNISFNVKNLLGGNENLTADEQHQIVSKMTKFLIR